MNHILNTLVGCDCWCFLLLNCLLSQLRQGFCCISWNLELWCDDVMISFWWSNFRAGGQFRGPSSKVVFTVWAAEQRREDMKKMFHWRRTRFRIGVKQWMLETVSIPMCWIWYLSELWFESDAMKIFGNPKGENSSEFLRSTECQVMLSAARCRLAAGWEVHSWLAILTLPAEPSSQGSTPGQRYQIFPAFMMD